MVSFVVSIWAASWSQNKRLEDMFKRVEELGRHLDSRMDEMSRRLDGGINEVVRRLDRIEELPQNYDRRITVLEERTSPLTRLR